MKNIKIRVYSNQKLLDLILQRLKELGGSHHGGSGSFDSAVEGGTYGLYVDAWQKISYASGDKIGTWFNNSTKGEITLDELFAMTPEPRETIKIGDSTYDKAEFEAATKNLKPIK